jgi:hypothetical protein
MRTSLALICSVAFACATSAQEESKSKKPTTKKTQAQSAQHAAAPSGGDADLRVRVAAPPTTTAGKPTGAGVPVNILSRYGSDLSTPSPRKVTTKAKPTTKDKPTSAPFMTRIVRWEGSGTPNAKPTPAPHGYAGRNDGRVQQSTAVGKPSPRNLTTNAKPSSEITTNAAPPSFVGRSSGVAKQTGAAAHKTKGPQQIATQGGQTTSGGTGSPAVQLHKFSNTTFKTQQGQGKPAKASKNNDQRSSPEYHKIWEDGKLPSGGTGMGKPTANASGPYSARVRSTAGGKKKSEKASPTPRPQ